MASSNLTSSKFFTSPSSSLKSCSLPRSISLPFNSSNPPPTLSSFSSKSKSFPKPCPCPFIASSSLNRNPPSSPLPPPYTPNHIPDPNYVRLFQTTLSGEQSPGATLTSKQKIDIARQLAKLGCDTMEVGFLSASEDDLEAVKTIAKEVGNAFDENGRVPVICVLCKCNEKDIKTAWEAVKYAKTPRIHIFIATSEIHMKYKLRKSKEEVLDIARNMVRFARSLGCDDVVFSPEDADRSDRQFLYEILGEVIKAGTTTLNLTDTVGVATPSEFGELIADIKANTPGIENVIISTHCQNDLGLSSANTIAGASAVARQVVEGTINGIGARARNASMEEVMMALKHRGGLYTGINAQHIVMASKMIEGYRGLHVQLHKVIVGANPFAHESGIHQVLSPEVIGLERSNKAGIVLGKLSGRHALRDRLKELGYELDDVQLENIFWSFKGVAEQKKRVTDADLIALVLDEVFQPEFVWKHLDQPITCGTLGLSTATVKLIDADLREHVACLVGTGPVDSAYETVDLIIKVEEYTGLRVLPHKAIVRANAFAHESGIHQDGMLKYKVTYEIISLGNLGLERSGNVLEKLRWLDMNVGHDYKLSAAHGCHALSNREKELEKMFWSIKEVAQQKRATKAYPIALVSDEVFQPRIKWPVLGLQVICGTIGVSTAAAKVMDADGRELFTCSVGTAPVGSPSGFHVLFHPYVHYLLPLVKPEIVSWSPRIIVLHNFLSYEECDYLRAIALPRLQVSTVVDAKTGMGLKSTVRTSSGMFLKPSETIYPMIQAIEKRISVFSQIPTENGEHIQVLRYERDQFYKPHHDYFSDRFNVLRGQRIATMLMYLSDDVEGGETYFPKAGTGVCSCGGKIVKGLSIKPIKGDAVLFWSMGLDGQSDPGSLHGGCAVLSACVAAIASSVTVGFDSEVDMLPFSTQFDRAHTSGLACNYLAGPRTSDPGRRTF
ncbi:hypothetical protein V6N13_055081 [Hibiscus sabdariffa]